MSLLHMLIELVSNICKGFAQMLINETSAELEGQFVASVTLHCCKYIEMKVTARTNKDIVIKGCKVGV